MAYNHEKGMCYLYEDRKICFIPIPKNGSTTIRRVLPQYMLSNFIKDPSILKDYRVVCIVRNPIERFCTGYLEVLKRANVDSPKTKEKKFFSINNEPDRFYAFVCEISRDGFFDAHIEPQLFYMTNLEDKIIVDQTYDIKDVEKFLKNEFNMINSEQHNSNPHLAKKQILNFLKQKKEIINLFLETYEKDIDFYKNLGHRINDI